MERLDGLSLQVTLAVKEINQGAERGRIKLDGHSVDGKIAAVKVKLDRGEFNGG